MRKRATVLVLVTALAGLLVAASPQPVGAGHGGFEPVTQWRTFKYPQRDPQVIKSAFHWRIDPDMVCHQPAAAFRVRVVLSRTRVDSAKIKAIRIYNENTFPVAVTRMYITGVSPGRLLLPPVIAPGEWWTFSWPSIDFPMRVEYESFGWLGEGIMVRPEITPLGDAWFCGAPGPTVLVARP